MEYKYHKEEKDRRRFTVNSDPDDESLSNTIQKWVEDVLSWVYTWENNQVKWHKLRMRIKKTKTFPFPGCSNIRMPTIDNKIKKLKSSLINTMFGIRPIVQVSPHPTGNWEKARKIEKYIDHLCMEVMDLKSKMIIIVDQTLEKGFYIAKPYYRHELTTRVETLTLDDISLKEATWLFDPARSLDEIHAAIAQRLQIDTSAWVLKENVKEVERVTKEILSGNDKVNFTLKDVLYNAPDVAVRPPERIYVPTTTGFDPQSASYIVDEFYLPLRTLKTYVNDKGWKEDAINQLKELKDVQLNEKQIDVKKDEREGIQRLQSTNELVKIHEAYAWYDINGDGVEEKCVVTKAADFNLLLRKISLPFYSGRFPFVKFFYELTDDRWYGHRGIPELIEDIVKEIDIQHMQKIDYGTLVNSPMFAFRAGQIGEDTTQFLFGQGLPVQGMNSIDDIIRPLNAHNPNVELSYEREQLMLETKVEELIGQVDSSLHSLINKREPRTATEVQQQSASMSQVFSLDADLFRTAFSDLINWIWELDCQYGDDDIQFSYLGEVIKLNREEIQGKYKIDIRGNDQNTNPVVRQEKAMFVLQDTYSAFTHGLSSPQAVMAARKRAYQEMEIEGWEEFVQPPPPPPPQTPIDDIKTKMEDLTDAEKAQVLMKMGIHPDIRGRQLNEENRRSDKEMEDLVSVAEVLNKGGSNESGDR